MSVTWLDSIFQSIIAWNSHQQANEFRFASCMVLTLFEISNHNTTTESARHTDTYSRWLRDGRINATILYPVSPIDISLFTRHFHCRVYEFPLLSILKKTVLLIIVHRMLRILERLTSGAISKICHLKSTHKLHTLNLIHSLVNIQYCD